MLAESVINGTWGQIWLDGDLVSECYGLQAKVTLTKSDINICGDLYKRSKVIGLEGKGTLKLHKVSSRMINKLSADIAKGKQTQCTIVTKLADPDSLGQERIALNQVIFDELTLADWEAKKNGEESVPFTFCDWDLLDTISAPSN